MQKFFLKLILLGFLGDNLLADLEKLFVADGISDIVKTKLIGMATDGASVMSGNIEGLYGQFKRFTNNFKLVHVHCLAHRLELVAEHAFSEVVTTRNINLWKLLTNSINGIANVFGTTAVKRKNLLVETCKDMNIEFYALRRIFEVRWAASQYDAIRAVLLNYGCIWRTLLKWSSFDDPREARSKDTADEWINYFASADFFAGISFFEDVFDVLKKYSKSYQKAAAVLPGQKGIYAELKARLQKLAEEDGPHLTAAITRIKCTNEDSDNLLVGDACKDYLYDRVKRIDDSAVVFLDHGIIVNEDEEPFKFDQYNLQNHPWGSLKAYRAYFIDAMILELDRYWTDDKFEIFQIMDPKLMRVNGEQIVFPPNSLQLHKELASELNINTPDIGLQLQNLFINVAVKVGYAQFKEWLKFPTEIFFAKLLEAIVDDDLIEFNVELDRYIASVLTVPAGSSDAERGFSIMNHILDDSRRKRIHVPTIDAILRIRLNGPPLKEFECFKFLEEWKKGGHLQSDEQAPRGPDVHNRNKGVEPSDDPIEDKLDDEFVRKMWQRRTNIFVPNYFELEN